MADIAERLRDALADRYLIERELGQGGMATVYLAHDIRHDRKVALKVLRAELAAILGGERFLHEIRTTANLQHPHILPLHDSGEADGIVYYVMPYVEGESLRDRLMRERQLPVEDAVRIAREVADALDYAHRKGVIHRDIKPENILLHDGRAQVADFGIALAVSTAGGGTRMTETGMSLGTPHYMSPEQAMGEREITPKADIYALGCVLYEMLAGEPPFTGPTAQAIVARVMTEQPRSLTIQRRTVPAHIEAAVHVALEKLPADRFASAAQFAEALGKTDFALPATRGAPAAAAPALQRRRALRAVPWVLLLLALGGGAWGWLRPVPHPVTRQRIVLWEHPVASGALARDLAISPDGATLVFVDSVGGTRQLWSKERDRIEATALAGTTGAGAPTFSPDGQWIAFVADGKLKKIPRLGGSSVTISDSANTVLPAIAWLDNGTIAYNNVRFSLLLVNQDGGPARTLVLVDSIRRGVVSAAALPRGRGVLFGACTFGCPEVDLRVVDLRSGAIRVLVDQVMRAWYTPGGQVVFVRRDGGVFAAPFDLDKLAFRSPPVPVLDGVRGTPFGADLALSPSGMLVYVSGASQSAAAPAEAVWVSRQGEATPIEPGWGFVPTSNGGLSLSPDGRRLALSAHVGANGDIWIKELDRGPFTRLTFEGQNTRPEWTADGRTVMYASGRPQMPGDVYARRADGTGVEAKLIHAARPVFEVLRTPDTTRLVIRFGSPPSRDLMLAHLGADSAIAPLVAAAGYEEVAPALSPDGRWLAYASNESGRYEVYVRPYPNTDGGRWEVSRNGGGEPLWSHTGRELFYRDGSGGLVSATVNPGSTFALGDQKVLFPAGPFMSDNSHRQYDVTPDDRRFVFVRFVGGPAAAGETKLIMVENWLSDIRSGGQQHRP
jgi:serine/threonine-protein kinase